MPRNFNAPNKPSQFRGIGNALSQGTKSAGRSAIRGAGAVFGNPKVAAGLGGISTGLAITQTLTDISKQRSKTVISQFSPSLHTSGVRHNLGVDPAAGMRFATRGRRFGGY